ncbi:MAG: hypothetical protein AAB919_02470 [Patescibacteria group bacterium]
MKKLLAVGLLGLAIGAYAVMTALVVPLNVQGNIIKLAYAAATMKDAGQNKTMQELAAMYAAAKDRVATLKAATSNNELGVMLESIRAANAEAAKLKSQIAAPEKELAELKTTIAELEKALGTVDKSGNKKDGDIGKQIADTAKLMEPLRARAAAIQQYPATIAKLKAELKAIGDTLVPLMHKNSGVVAQAANFYSVLGQAQADVAQIEKGIAGFNGTFGVQVDWLETQSADLKRKVLAARALADRIQALHIGPAPTVAAAKQ